MTEPLLDMLAHLKSILHVAPDIHTGRQKGSLTLLFSEKAGSSFLSDRLSSKQMRIQLVIPIIRMRLRMMKDETMMRIRSRSSSSGWLKLLQIFFVSVCLSAFKYEFCILFELLQLCNLLICS